MTIIEQLTINYSVNQAASILGVSTQTVRRMIKAKKLKSLKIGRRVLVPTWALLDFNKESTV